MMGIRWGLASITSNILAQTLAIADGLMNQSTVLRTAYRNKNRKKHVTTLVLHFLQGIPVGNSMEEQNTACHQTRVIEALPWTNQLISRSYNAKRMLLKEYYNH
jgi:hypothetical protein